LGDTYLNLTTFQQDGSSATIRVILEPLVRGSGSAAASSSSVPCCRVASEEDRVNWRRAGIGSLAAAP